VTAADVSAAEVAAGLEQRALVAVDVRTAEEWQGAHIAGATWIPMNELAGRMTELPEGIRLAMVCRSGARSGVVADHLVAAGYDAVNMAGGMYAWVAAGLPIEPDDGLVL
jgi:rhodanese-related sulfurtransferase